MPEMDGLEATRRILERWPDGERPWIVAMTAKAMAGDRERCLAAGMDDYIAKPIRIEELVAAHRAHAAPRGEPRCAGAHGRSTTGPAASRRGAWAATTRSSPS